MKDIKAQGELNAKLSPDISNLRQEAYWLNIRATSTSPMHNEIQQEKIISL
jgi:hypothetical protein